LFKFIATNVRATGAVAGLPTTRCERSEDTEGGIKPAIASLALLAERSRGNFSLSLFFEPVPLRAT
jgi:hypothetical protein